jgi:hypothetical protein
MKERLGTPEQQKAVDEWRSQIGQSLVHNLNRNVMREGRANAPVRPAAASVRTGFKIAYFVTLAAVLIGLYAWAS